MAFKQEDVMQMVNATASVALVDWNVMNAWTFILDFLTVKITVIIFPRQKKGQNFNFSYFIACNCDGTGSTSLVCNKTSGQCPCKSNVSGLQCRVCQDGFKNHPKCTSN